ncbi:hypothetical protein S7711_01735 [Stachybotrys chartarum IBT 7711]|uniref:Aminotransferase class I/classII large domain-containing protein n=1 Tax=Stachybotrys chartarum (strain CBS 109288 / IBT 7711) TaxID=1280523 RepID=A0A084AVF5_STACB|nr:hypothetical protein S7711_01735 [Stachybotrys chartarum IBT 7711]
MTLSQRAQELAKPDPRSMLWDIMQNGWCPETNPGGYVNLGVAESSLMHEELSKHLHKHMDLPTQAFTYGDGSKRLKAALARFFDRYFKPVIPIEPSHIIITNGCTSSIEQISWLLSNPGDVVLLGRPYYGAFVGDITVRTGAELVTIPFDGLDPVGLDAVAKYETKILEAKAKGQRVAALFLCHPHNPLGRCYSRRVLIDIMKLCQHHQIHLVSDEIYALSTFSNTIDAGTASTPFESCLSIDTTGIIDPGLLHILWGVSKDFGANGLRLGMIISQNNPTLHKAVVPVALFSSASSMSEHVVANLLEDEAWVQCYLEENRTRLASRFEHVARWAKQHGIEYQAGVNAAFFLWVNLGATYRRLHGGKDVSDIDNTVMDALLAQRIFVASGVNFGSEAPGWFRIVFSHQTDYLDEGLRRIITAIE